MSNLIVPLPDLPPEPVAYAHSLVTLTGFGLGILGAAGFTVVVLAFARLLRRGGPARGLLWTFLGVMVGGLALAYVTSTSGERIAKESHTEYLVVDRAAQDAVRVRLEAAYRLTFDDLVRIPLVAGDHSREDMTFADGRSQECFVVAEPEGYQIRCGGTGPADATPIEPTG